MVQSTGGLTTHWTGARVSDPLIVELAVAALCTRPVNSGDRHAAIKVESDKPVVGWIRETAKHSLNKMNRLRSISSLNPTGISLPFIVSLSHDAVVSRRVNSGVRRFRLLKTEEYDEAEPNLLNLSANFTVAKWTKSLFH